MECIKFEIGGKSAHFKNPENNYSVEFSFSHITKVATLGIVGAIIGLDGRGQIYKHKCIKWWEELKSMKVAIVSSKPKFETFINTSNNSTGFANKAGSTQQFRHQILVNPSWNIYLTRGDVKEEYWDILKNNLKNRVSEYPIYLGNNHHVANIGEVEFLDLEIADLEGLADEVWCDSLILNSAIEDISEDKSENSDFRYKYKLEEYMPTGLNELTLHEVEKVIFTNLELTLKDGEVLYKDEEKLIYFM